jgi:hypothetical protein
VGATVAVWSFTLEEIPGDPKGVDDVAWSVGFGALATVVLAFVCGVGVLLGRRLRSRRRCCIERLLPATSRKFLKV